MNKEQWLTPPELQDKEVVRQTVGMLSLATIEGRQDRIEHMGFVPYTLQEIQVLVDQLGDQRVLEVGAGTGYLARLLHDRGVTIRAVDPLESEWGRVQWRSQPPYFNVERIDHSVLAPYPADAIIMVWPCLSSDFAADVLMNMTPGQRLFYRGESKGGCTANDRFFDLLKTHARYLEEASESLSQSAAQDCCINDYWGVYERHS